MNRKRLILLTTLSLIIITLACLLINSRFKDPHVHAGDTPAYLAAAHNLARHGVFSEVIAPKPSPHVGREPGYALFLAALISSGTSLGNFDPACIQAAAACDRAIFRDAQYANVALALSAALLLCLTAWRITGWIWSGVIAFAYLMLNAQAFSWRHYLVSDYLAIWLVALVAATTVFWLKGKQRPLPAAATGLALAALILTKAIYLYLLPLIALAWLIFRGRSVGGPAASLPRWTGLAFITAALPVLAWMLRNYLAVGEFVLTDSRSGIALSTREVFNHMGFKENIAAFVFWTRGFGDGLAMHLFEPYIWQPFQLDWPGGYYDLGQHRYMPWVERVVAERGLSDAEARRIVDGILLRAYADQPFGYLLSYPAVFYRGIWIDEFIVVGLPALFTALMMALRRRELAMIGVLLPGLFNLAFYPAISLNIPRYQLTALPAIALAVAWLTYVYIRHQRQTRGLWTNFKR